MAEAAYLLWGYLVYLVCPSGCGGGLWVLGLRGRPSLGFYQVGRISQTILRTILHPPAAVAPCNPAATRLIIAVRVGRRTLRRRTRRTPELLP